MWQSGSVFQSPPYTSGWATATSPSHTSWATLMPNVRPAAGILKRSRCGWRIVVIDNATLILGPPGCGKTYTLIERVEAKLQEGVHPSRIGVVSFTTKAIGEFVERATTKFNLTKNDFPHFRTLHATGYHGLGLERGDVMSGEDYKVLGKILGLEFKGADSTSMDDGVAVP